MKKIMKKVLSLVLVLVMMMVPMTAFAEDPIGSEFNADTIESGSANINVEPGATYYFYHLPANYGDYTIKVTGETGFKVGVYDVPMNNMPTIYNDTNGAVEANITTQTMLSDIRFMVMNTTSETQQYAVTVTAKTGSGETGEPAGTPTDPADLVVGTTQSATVNGSYDLYYFGWTPTVSGTLTVSMDITTANWIYTVVVNNRPATEFDPMMDAYGDSSSSDIKVEAGDEVLVGVNLGDQTNVYEGTVSFSTTFVPGETGGNEGGNQGGNEGGDQGGNEGGNEDGNQGEDDVNYEMGAALEVGTNEYSASNGFTYTVYTFEPTEAGKYTITSADSKLGIVSYNGMWVTITPSEETVAENTIVWECTGVGQSIWVAAKADTNVANITVSREDLIIEETKKTTYVNTEKPEAFKYTGNVDKLLEVYVDTDDSVVDKAVPGEDGYYHLNTVDGPILYVNLSDTLMNLVDAMGYGQLKEVIYEDEKAVEVIDYNTAFGEYVTCADSSEKATLYPLTKDLMTIYQNVGEAQGWYGENGAVGGTKDDAWMFACYYEKEATTGGTTAGGTTTGTTTGTNTGDSANVAVWAIVMVVAAGAAFVVAESKRRAR